MTININYFMSEAIKLAELAYKNDEVPVGAVIVYDGKIIGRGFNKVIADHSVVSHAEINAIKEASSNIQNYRLKNCKIFVTLEPCHMCAKAIVDARIETVYFGASELKTGAIHSIDNFLDRSDLNHQVRYFGGFMQAESSALLTNFFQDKRLSKKFKKLNFQVD